MSKQTPKVAAWSTSIGRRLIYKPEVRVFIKLPWTPTFGAADLSKGVGARS